VLLGEKVFENKVWLWKLYLFKIRNDFKSPSKLVLFDSNEKGSDSLFTKLKWVSKSIELKNLLCFDSKNKGFQSFFFETCIDFNPEFKSFACHPPHHSNRFSKLLILKSFGYLRNVFIQNDYELRVPANSKHLSSKRPVWQRL
jgi:hypothetical protein